LCAGGKALSSLHLEKKENNKFGFSRSVSFQMPVRKKIAPFIIPLHLFGFLEARVESISDANIYIYILMYTDIMCIFTLTFVNKLLYNKKRRQIENNMKS